MFLRKCRECGLEAATEEDLEKFSSHVGSKHGRANLCRVCRAKKSQQWYRANLERASENDRRWREANSERKRETNRAWIEANKERVKENNRRWAQENPGRARDKAQRWRAKHPERAVEVVQRRRARRRNATILELPPALSLDLMEEFWRGQGWSRDSCSFCGTVSNEIQIDHVVPLARGGPEVFFNLAPACPDCNQTKNQRDPVLWAREKLDDAATSFERAQRTAALCHVELTVQMVGITNTLRPPEPTEGRE